ncbi:hypothetical protein AB0L57_19580 [Nocardia sp. NPDC052254]|uniref:hypothetical protein n=1 Tax=Nocardia sp. NPDC052254 TaxID=3155681 RepID=UPI00342F3C0F
MTHRPRVRSLIVAATGAALLPLGAGLLTTAPANAAPRPAVPARNPNFPLGGGEAEQPGKPEKEPRTEKDPRAERAEKLGGATATDIINMSAHLLKCGLNIAAPTVKCD